MPEPTATRSRAGLGSLPDRIPISAANWKMNLTTAEAEALCADLAGIDEIGGVEIVIAPGYLQLETVARAFAGAKVWVAGQNMHSERNGAFTGEVSPMQLAAVASWVLIGHSERRQLFCESDELIQRKLAAAEVNGLTPILCVGETQEERELNKTDEVLSRQVRTALSGYPVSDELVVAYEPVWAIGSGEPATPEQAQEAAAYIRDQVGDVIGRVRAELTRILYGGSVKPDNVAAFARQPDIDGALVGGASLDADAFIKITDEISRAV